LPYFVPERPCCSGRAESDGTLPWARRRLATGVTRGVPHLRPLTSRTPEEATMLKYMVVVVVLVACGPVPFPGAPVPGESCSASTPECVSSDEVAFCEASNGQNPSDPSNRAQWVSYVCPGECRLQGTKCDWIRAAAGDRCAPQMAGNFSFCTGNKKALECKTTEPGTSRFVEVGCPNGCMTQSPTAVNCN
jgi:hypothetical protein